MNWNNTLPRPLTKGGELYKAHYITGQA